MSLSPLERQLLLDQIARCYGIEPSQFRCLTDNPEDGVYGFKRHGQECVMKYTLPTERTFDALQAQVDWINFLALHDVPVARPIPSQQGLLVEQLPFNDSMVSVVCYQHVLGERPSVPALTAEQWQGWGQTLGKLHALSMHYTPPQQRGRFDHWDTRTSHDRRAIPAEQTLVLEKFDALQQYFRSLPKDPHVYGVIHGDMQANNLCLDNGQFWIIDFDNCAYDWFLLDIATSLYFTLWERPPKQSNAEFAAFVLEHMVAGYRREHILDGAWLDELPTFLKLIEMYSYVAINEHNQVASQNSQEDLPAKHCAMLRRYRNNIEHDVPYIESAYHPWLDA